jgi:hypothetical protein
VSKQFKKYLTLHVDNSKQKWWTCDFPFSTQSCVKNVLKIVLIIVNINKDENKSLISNKFSLKNDL